MLEVALLVFAGLLPIAATGHRLRRDAGVATARQGRALRIVGGVVLLAAFAIAGTEVPGEGSVRFLGATSLAGVVLILALSAKPRAVLWPVRVVLRSSSASPRRRADQVHR